VARLMYLLIILGLGSFLTAPVLALEENSNATAQQYAEQLIRQRLAMMGLQVERLQPAVELEGFYQVFTGQGLFYVSADGARLVAGKVFSIEAQPIDLTEMTVSNVRQELVKENTALTIKYPAPNERYKITVFTDHTCPYCRQLHEQLDAYHAAGISIEYLAFPRAGLEHRSATELNNIFCAADPATAMTRAMAGEKPLTYRCDVSMADHLSLARQMGITGTPGIILPNGQLIPGFVPPDRLLSELRNSSR